MAGFVGYILQSNGFYFPWALTGTTSFADIAAAGSPPDQWDALPTEAKVQILCFVGFLEICGESTYILEQSGAKHYMKGGKPGFYPSLKGVMPHPVPLGARSRPSLPPRVRLASSRRALCLPSNQLRHRSGTPDCGGGGGG